jgi:hypothetical protein
MKVTFIEIKTSIENRGEALETTWKNRKPAKETCGTQFVFNEDGAGPPLDESLIGNVCQLH